MLAVVDTVDSRVYGNTLATSFTFYPIVSAVGTRVLAMLKRGLLKHVTLNSNSAVSTEGCN